MGFVGETQVGSSWWEDENLEPRMVPEIAEEGIDAQTENACVVPDHECNDQQQHQHHDPDTPLDAMIGDQIATTTQLFAQTNVHDIPYFRYVDVPAEDREKALQDLHGALDLVAETPELIESKLDELEKIVDSSLSSSDEACSRNAYDLALQQNTSYVKDLRISFLRAEKFNVQRAAQRMLAHFDTRLSLFRDLSLLGRDIRLGDFQSDEDLEVLRRGICQLLPSRDRVGRPIIFVSSPQEGQPPCSFKSKMKLLFWLGQLVTRLGEEVQRKGAVVIWYGIGAPSKKDGAPTHGMIYFSVMDSFSTAATSVHSVYDNMNHTICMNNLAARAEKSDNVFRFRSHFGTLVACLHSLMAYGIPKSLLPVRVDGSIRVEDHNIFLKDMAQKEKTAPLTSRTAEEFETLISCTHTANRVSPRPLDDDESSSEHVPPPTEMDIICGRGQRGAKNPGNMLLKRLMTENAERYDKSSRDDKTLVIHEIYRYMRQAGCRFLAPAEEARTAQDRRYKPELWKEVDDMAARERISHRFRNIRKAAARP